ncbi:hypothetical protein R1sor_013152 [Riccia sorocarpa]|uniref:Uncharacterized protein n=1 Tax=Riccia sorocarpa TaxID=122646 RepID=A0ABD3H6A3_9MARC
MAPHPSPATLSQDPEFMSSLSAMFAASSSTQLPFTQEQLAGLIATYVPLAANRRSAPLQPVTQSPLRQSSPVIPITQTPPVHPSTAPVRPPVVRPSTAPTPATIPVPACDPTPRASSSQSHGRARGRSHEPEVAPGPGRRVRGRRDRHDATPTIVLSGIGLPKLLSRKCLLDAVRKVCGLRVQDHQTVSELSEEQIYRIKLEVRGRFSNGIDISEDELEKMLMKYLRDHKNHYLSLLKNRLEEIDHVADPNAELTIGRPGRLREQSLAPLLHIARQIFWFGYIDTMQHELALARSVEEAGGQPTRPSTYYARGLEIAREKSALYGLPDEKYALAAERRDTRYEKGWRTTHHWGQMGLHGFKCRFFQRFRREVSAAEREYANEYGEDRLIEFLNGGGTFHNDEDINEDEDAPPPPPPAGADGAGPSHHWHSQERDVALDSEDRRYIYTVVGRVESSQVGNREVPVPHEEDPAPRVRGEPTESGRSSANPSQHMG